jgi:hypothetical protein
MPNWTTHHSSRTVGTLCFSAAERQVRAAARLIIKIILSPALPIPFHIHIINVVCEPRFQACMRGISTSLGFSVTRLIINELFSPPFCTRCTWFREQCTTPLLRFALAEPIPLIIADFLTYLIPALGCALRDPPKGCWLDQTHGYN